MFVLLMYLLLRVRSGCRCIIPETKVSVPIVLMLIDLFLLLMSSILLLIYLFLLMYLFLLRIYLFLLLMYRIWVPVAGDALFISGLGCSCA
jgi:hypothetical protein